MSEVTVYFVQPFKVAGRCLVRGDLRHTRNLREAERLARAAEIKAAGAILYSVTGSPEFEVWSEPKVLARLGVVPG
jgi:hypothetical protein